MNATAGWIGILILLILMFARMPIGFTMVVVGFGGIVYLQGLDAAFSTLSTSPYYSISNYVLSSVPFFVLMGEFAFRGGISESLYMAAYKIMGSIRGGLSMASVAACAAFSALSGSSFATAATLGAVALPEMRKYGYNPGLATGCLAAGGTLGILIPPSIPMIIYGVMAQESIGKLLIAGLIPGIVLAVLFMAVIWVLCRINIQLGPGGPQTNFRQKINALGSSWQVLLIFLAIIGGLYLGIFTPTEAGAAGAFLVFIISFVQKKLNWVGIRESGIETLQVSAMIFVILIGAALFSQFMGVSGLPIKLANIISSYGTSDYAVIALIVIVYLILGCFMDALSMIILTLPIILPIVQAVHISLIWFGVLVVITMEMGLITPPVGLNVFIIKGIAKDVPLRTIFMGTVPFLGMMFVCVVLIVIFPQIVMVLPNMMK